MTSKTPEKISKIFGEEGEAPSEEWLTEYEGQLALDAFQTEDQVVIKAPIAGVRPEDLEVTIHDEQITVKGERKQEHQVKEEDYFAQECYWGVFSRSIALPPGCDIENAKASLKNGVLTIIIPKLRKGKTKIVKIEAE